MTKALCNLFEQEMDVIRNAAVSAIQHIQQGIEEENRKAFEAGRKPHDSFYPGLGEYNQTAIYQFNDYESYRTLHP